MKNIAFIIILFLIPLSVLSQKVAVQLIKTKNSAISSWQIQDEQFQVLFSGSEFSTDDSAPFALEANKKYTLHVTVSEILISDTSLYSILLKGEPILLIKSDIGTGDHLFPFFSGTLTRDAKITGGTGTVISDFPWQIYLIAGNSRCGGSIINENWVLTAAHCTKNSSGGSLLPADMSIKVGANNPYSSSEGKTYNVSQIIVNENYNSQTLDNDIALLRISGPINYPNAVPIKLVSSEDVADGAIIPGVMSWVTGWGLTSVSPSILPLNLQKVQLPIVSNSQAATRWTSIPLTDMMAGYLNGNTDACNGDSGGPLVVPVFGEYKLAGIVSWGSASCNTYGAYTRVSDFGTWISTKTGIPKAYIPISPAGDTIICQGTESSTYSVTNLPSATAYEWKLYPADAGVITGNSANASVLWNIGKTGSVAVMLREAVNGTVSDWSKLKVNIVQNTKLLSQSKDTVLCAEQPISLNVSADGYNINYSWYKNNTLVQTGSSNRMIISSTLTGNTGDYICKIAGSCGTKFSSNIKLTVLPLTKITYISPDVEVPFGNDITLEVNSEGHDLVYQWLKDDVLLPNSNTTQLFIQELNARDIGLYQANVTGTCGSETSDTVYVYVQKTGYSEEPEVFVWPTLTSNEFNVALSSDAAYDYNIVSSMGKLIMSKTNCHYQTSVNISTLPRGVYIVNVFNKNIRKSTRLIKI
jgi:secreted trypsin-like serine protease